MNQVIEHLKGHVSIRKFNGEKISRESERHIIEAAVRGANAGNMMAYSIIKIRSKDILGALADSCDNQPFIGDADLALLFVVDNYKWHRYFQLKEIPNIYPEYAGPVINDMVLGMQDAMIAAQNAVMAAESLGIGTCYIGDVVERYEYHKELFNLPEYTMPATLIVMGHYDKKPAQNSRFDHSYVVFEDKYPLIDNNFIRGMFEDQEKASKDFAKSFFKRKINADFFLEMKRSLYLYCKQWLDYEKLLVEKEIVTCKQMKGIERKANQGGLSYYQMMENAGAGAASIITEEPVKGKNILVFCGRGNNGGDGFVVARKLHEAGADVKIILVHGEPKTQDAIKNLKLCRNMSIPEIPPGLKDAGRTNGDSKVDIIVDAIYGTGFRAGMDKETERITSFINNGNTKVYSLDIPSGLNGDTGMADPGCVIAGHTLVFHRLKPAHVIAGTEKYCGRCILVDIGIV